MRGLFLYVTWDGKVSEVIASVTNEEDGAALKKVLLEAADDIGEGRSRQVIAIEVLPDFQTYLAKGAEPIEARQIFPSGLAASQALRFKGNSVAQALHKAKQENKTKAELRGVIWQYVDDFVAD